jgi:hypothetical protein
MSTSHISETPGARRVGNAWVIPATPCDDLCLRCGMDTQQDKSPYPYPLHENGVDYFLCWDCGPSEWQQEVIDWEATICEADRLLS